MPYIEVSSVEKSEHPLASSVLPNVPTKVSIHSSQARHVPNGPREALSDKIDM